MTGSNRRPSACKADALPAELILHIVKEKIFFASANGTLFSKENNLVTPTGLEPVLPP